TPPAPAGPAAAAAASPGPAPRPTAACRSPRRAGCASRTVRTRAAAPRRGAATRLVSSPATRAPRSRGPARSRSPPSRPARRDDALRSLRVPVRAAVAQPAPLEQRRHLGHLRGIAFLRVGTARPEPAGQLVDQPPHHVEPVGTAEERDVGLVVDDLLGELRAVRDPG